MAIGKKYELAIIYISSAERGQIEQTVSDGIADSPSSLRQLASKAVTSKRVHYHLVWPPFVSITACIRRGIPSIHPSRVSWESAFHSTTTSSNSSAALWDLSSVALAHRLRSLAFENMPAFSIGLRSGELGGHGSCSWPESSRNF